MRCDSRSRTVRNNRGARRCSPSLPAHARVACVSIPPTPPKAVFERIPRASSRAGWRCAVRRGADRRPRPRPHPLCLARDPRGLPHHGHAVDRHLVLAAHGLAQDRAPRHRRPPSWDRLRQPSRSRTRMRWILAAVAGLAAIWVFISVLAQREGAPHGVQELAWSRSPRSWCGRCSACATTRCALAPPRRAWASPTGIAAMLSASIGALLAGISVAASAGALLLVWSISSRPVAPGILGTLTVGVIDRAVRRRRADAGAVAVVRARARCCSFRSPSGCRARDRRRPSCAPFVAHGLRAGRRQHSHRRRVVSRAVCNRQS